MNNILLNGSALYSYLNTNSTVDIYYQKVQNATPPYCLVTLVSGNDDYTFDSEGFSADYIIKIVSNRQFPLEAIELYGDIHELVQDANLGLPGIIKIRRESIINFEDDNNYQHVGGLYRLETWE